jgi:hypothetical protein
MTASRFFHFTVSVVAASALLAGCGGSANVAPSASVQGASAVKVAAPIVGDRIAGPPGAAFPSVTRSWMAPNAAKQQLLYVSDQGANTVDVFSYPGDALLGSLSGFDIPQGLCVDGAADVFVADLNNSRVREYAHGSITPKATLQDPGYSPVSCSIDPTTGNLAVGNISGSGGVSGNVAIYKGAIGSPIAYYSAPSLFQVFFCTYDASGNLWVDGQSSSSEFDLAELKKGSKKFTHIFVNQTFHEAGGVQWVGKYLAIGDIPVDTIYRFLVTGDKATSVGGVALSGAGEVVQYLVASGKLIGPDFSNKDVGIWNFPAGGTALKTITGFGGPFGVAISTVKT